MHEPSTPRSRLLAAGLLIAPLLLVASTVAYLLGDGLGEDSAGGAIQVYAAAALTSVIVVLTGMLAPAAPRLSAVLTATGLIGTAGAAGWAIDSIVYSYAPLSAASEHEGSIAAQFALFLPGVIFPLTLAVIGVALAVTATAPRRPALTLALGAACFPVSRIGSIGPLALVADLLILGGLVPIGWATLHPRDPKTIAAYAVSVPA